MSKRGKQSTTTVTTNKRKRARTATSDTTPEGGLNWWDCVSVPISPHMVHLSAYESMNDYERRHRDGRCKRVAACVDAARDHRASAADAERALSASDATEQEREQLCRQQDALQYFIMEIDTQALISDTLSGMAQLKELAMPLTPDGEFNAHRNELEAVVNKICDPARPHRGLMIWLHLVALLVAHDGYYSYVRAHCPDPCFMDRFRAYTAHRARAAFFSDPSGDLALANELAARYVARDLPLAWHNVQ